MPVFLQLDDELHKLICSFPGTNFIWETIENLKANIDRIRFFTIIDRISPPDELVEEHEQLVALIKADKIEDACTLLERHIYEIGNTYKQVRDKCRQWFLD